MGDFAGLQRAVVRSLERTLEADEAARFDRFATAVLGSDDSAPNREVLRERAGRVLELRRAYNERNLPAAGDPQFGFARVDAFGAILNEVTGGFLDIGRNYERADAPVSFPFLWDTPHHDVVQWNGSARNHLGPQPLMLGALSRNAGEVLGVFGEVTIPGEPPAIPGYRSTVRIGNLRDIEKRLFELKSPRWPEAFPPIDPAKRAAGKELFGRYCVRCHDQIDRDDADRSVIARMSDTGTDPAAARNFIERTAMTGRLEGSRVNFNPLGDRFEQVEPGETVLAHAVVGVILGGWREAPEDILHDLRYGRGRAFSASPPGFDPPAEYKGRPLNGVWATAPYLHNGSVPTLRDLLRPASKRPPVFWVGRREFDADAVGFRNNEGPDLFRFDTSLPGNLNAGHEYGTGVAEEDGGDGLPPLDEGRQEELLEYLKSL